MKKLKSNLLSMLATEEKGRIHMIGAVAKGVLHAEKLKKKERNVHLCTVNNSKADYIHAWRRKR